MTAEVGGDFEGEVPVQHDPVAEQNDLLTGLEAQARIEERMRPLRRRARELESRVEASNDEFGAAQVELEGCRAEIDRLEQAFRRYSQDVGSG